MSTTKIEMNQGVTLSFNDLVAHAVNNLKKNIPMYIKGYSGFGKTAAVEIAARQLAEIEKKKVQFSVFYGSANEGSDFNGLQWIVDGKLQSFKPEKFNLEKDTVYVFFFDELNRCRKDVRNALLPLFARPEHRRIGEHDLSMFDIRLIAAGNAGHDDFQVDELDPAFNERVRHVTLQASLKEVTAYFAKKYSDNNLFNLFLQSSFRENCFASDFSDVINMTHAEKPVPRMLEYAVQECDGLEVEQIDNFVLTAVQMTVGMNVVSAFRDFLSKMKRLDANEFFVKNSKAIGEILKADVNAGNAEILLTALNQCPELVKTVYADNKAALEIFLDTLIDKVAVKYAEVVAAGVQSITASEVTQLPAFTEVMFDNAERFDKFVAFGSQEKKPEPAATKSKKKAK